MACHLTHRRWSVQTTTALIVLALASSRICKLNFVSGAPGAKAATLSWRSRCVWGARLVARSADPGAAWQARFQEFQDFIAREHCLPKNHQRDKAETTLAQWLSSQKKSQRKGNLDPDQLRQLRDVHPLVQVRIESWLDPEIDWRTKLQELQRFVLRENCLPKEDHPDKAVCSLAQWLCSQQRSQHTGNLATERLQQLRGAHLLLDARVESWLDPDIDWRTTLQEMCGFVVRESRLPKVGRPDKVESRLAQWLCRQQSLHRLGDLADERLQQLRHAHPLIEARVEEWFEPSRARVTNSDAEWLTRLQELVAFIATEGRLPKQHQPSKAESSLGRWLSSQQKSQRLGNLAAERLRRLRDSHPLVESRVESWFDLDIEWRATLQGLGDFVLREERLPKVDQSEEAETRLGEWLARQQAAQRLGNLGAGRLRQLRSAHPLLEARVTSWLERPSPVR